MVEATRVISGAVSTERRYYISGLVPSALTIAQAVRAHWRVKLEAFAARHGLRRGSVPHRRKQRRVELRCPSAHRDELAQARYHTQSGLKIRRLKACANDYIAELLGWRGGKKFNVRRNCREMFAHTAALFRLV
jgi:hypothetical protein